MSTATSHSVLPVAASAGEPAAATSLTLVLAFTAINSLGSGVVTMGISFLARSAYGFSDNENFGLSLVMGLAYIPAAMFAGPALRSIRHRLPWFTTRLALLALMLALGATCMLPWTVDLISNRGPVAGGARSGAWTMWVVIGLYAALTGALWPMVESFMSGGRSGHRLRSSIGVFNIVWSSAVVVGFVAIGPVQAGSPLAVIAAVGLAHIASALFLIGFRADPGRHIHEAHEPHPSRYRGLLEVFRLALPAGYMVTTALQPYMPTVVERLAIPVWAHTPLAATWFGTRVLAFAVLERWQGWHGRWSMPIIGGALILAGFAAAVLSPDLAAAAGRPAGIAALLAGLGAFGIGMGTVYAGALYYAMEVGQAEVDAGGTHEALIGVGYVVGPACGLIAAGGVSAGVVTQGSFDTTMIGLIMLCTLALATVALLKVRAAIPRR
ncbi:MAG: hypothetical protein H7Y88_04565 [Phycisphaerales bacterium]|nr:hypothetical protein [Phycisphaerales bacterium]